MPLTANQIKWAATHDWFIAADAAEPTVGYAGLPLVPGYTVRVIDDCIHWGAVPNELVPYIVSQTNVDPGSIGQKGLRIHTRRPMVFDDFEALEAWAGY